MDAKHDRAMPPTTPPPSWPALAAWAAGWIAMARLDGTVDLANLAMVLVLTSALASLWSPTSVSILLSAGSVLAFNWLFVPPRGTFSVDVPQHALLLASMLGVSCVLALLISRARSLARQAEAHAREAEQMRRFAQSLRDATQPLTHSGALQSLLADEVQGTVVLLLLKGSLPQADDPQAVELLGEPDADQLSGLWLCMRGATPFGPGTGRHEGLREWFLPLRGGRGSLGAALLRPDPLRLADANLRLHAQALCDQLGAALQRAHAERAEREAIGKAQAEGMRSAMLTAISHDYRTPLATILGAASSLHEQGDRMSAQQRDRLVCKVLDETARLARLADNTLQLARLDSPGATLHGDWESAEELVGAVLRRVRERDPQRRVRARLEPGLPLIRCDGAAMAQMLDNLLDNALKYSPSPAPVELLVRRQDDRLVIAVRDRGPGVSPPWRERIFEVFERAPQAVPQGDAGARPGAGVGLAVCRAIARIHGGELRLRQRAHGGSSFECWLPLAAAPVVADA